MLEMSLHTLPKMSKTYQYRKVMKPMLERKRRARINKCLDELKDLMIATLESEGEHITRLEKADILELTVTHLQKLKQQRNLAATGIAIAHSPITQAEGFRSGFVHAVNEVSRSLTEIGVDVNLGSQLHRHLGQRLNQLQPAIRPTIPVTAPISVYISSNNATFNQSNVACGSVSSPSNHTHHTATSSSLSLSPSSSTISEPHNVASLVTICQGPHPENLSQKPDHPGEEIVWRPW